MTRSSPPPPAITGTKATYFRRRAREGAQRHLNEDTVGLLWKHWMSCDFMDWDAIKSNCTFPLVCDQKVSHIYDTETTKLLMTWPISSSLIKNNSFSMCNSWGVPLLWTAHRRWLFETAPQCILSASHFFFYFLCSVCWIRHSHFQLKDWKMNYCWCTTHRPCSW